jgi:predicted secreted protein
LGGAINALLAAGAMALSLGGACTAESPAPGTVAVIVTAADAGKSVQLALHQQLQIRLETQLGTGFSWQILGPIPAGLAFVTSTVKDESLTPGGAEMQTLIFRAEQAGSAMLKLGYIQPWDKQSAPARLFVLTVHVASK